MATRHKVEIKKDSPSSQHYGSSRDQVYQPASYKVLRDGKKVGLIRAYGVRYMESPDWRVLEIVGGVSKEVKIFWGDKGKPFIRAKAWALKHFK